MAESNFKAFLTIKTIVLLHFLLLYILNASLFLLSAHCGKEEIFVLCKVSLEPALTLVRPPNHKIYPIKNLNFQDEN
jgi:hypothetical protein